MPTRCSTCFLFPVEKSVSIDGGGVAKHLEIRSLVAVGFQIDYVPREESARTSAEEIKKMDTHTSLSTNNRPDKKFAPRFIRWSWKVETGFFSLLSVIYFLPLQR